MADCIFCKIASHEQPADIIYEDDQVVAFHDINPQAPTHVLVIPRRHISRVANIQKKDQELIGRMIFVAKQQADELGIAENGYRLVFNNGRHAGQDVYHIHLHLLGGRAFRWPPG